MSGWDCGMAWRAGLFSYLETHDIRKKRGQVMGILALEYKIVARDDCKYHEL